MVPNTSPTPDQTGQWVITEFGGPSVLQWKAQDIERELAADEVLVRILAAGFAGVDNIQRAGGYPDPRCAKPGFTPGYEFVGDVVRLGSSVTTSAGLAVGDRVLSMCVLGAHATHIIIPSSELIRINPEDDVIKACALPLNYTTAWGMLKHSGVDLKPGNTILIGSASGGVGTAMAQLVHTFKLGLKMIGTSSPSKFDYLKSLGVIPVDRHASDIVEQVRALTGGAGVDVAYDAVGSKESLLRSYEATRDDGGQVICIGVMDEIKADGTGLRSKASEIHALIASRLPPRSGFFSVTEHYQKPKRQEFVDDIRAMLGKIRAGELDPEIFKLYRLSDLVKAHEDIISGKDIKGKMVIVVDGDMASKHGL